jgi:hypothetical protein
MTPLAIIGMIAALAFGVYWGMPARYQPDLDEIDEALEDPGRERHRTRRATTWLGLLQRTVTRGSHRRRGRPTRRAFQMEAPEPRPEPPSEPPSEPTSEGSDDGDGR